MSTIGTFDGFTAARLGIYAAQQGLMTTGNNISNVNTPGYTRQRTNQMSFKAGAYDRYRSQWDNHIGSGALVRSISQIRDPYLDVRFRNVSAETYYNDTMLTGLQEIARILDEVGKGENPDDNEYGDGMLYAQLQDLADKLRAYEAEPNKSNNDLARTAAGTLCSLFNDYANKLERLYNDKVQQYNDQVDIVNECLNNIRELNRQIRDCEVYGDSALEMRDERNRQIDTLSQYLHIKVKYTEEDIGCGQMVEKLSIYLDDNGLDGTMLIDGIYGSQLSRRQVDNPAFDPGQPESETNPKYIDDEYFRLTVSKLLDAKGKEWTSTTSSKVAADLAKYRYKLTLGTDWVAGETFEVSGKVFEIVDKEGDPVNTPGATPVTAEIANDPEKMAAFIAKNLKNDDYNVSVDARDPDNIYLVFTAKNPGEVGKSGPEKAPTLTVINGDKKIEIEGQEMLSEGKELPENETNADGQEILYSYVKGGDGKWYMKTTTVTHTEEVNLEDNDIYGALQATRELLIEKGEFCTEKDLEVDPDGTLKRGIPYYQMSLDLLARKLATEFNKLNTGYMQDEYGYYINEKGERLMLEGDDGIEYPVSSTDGLNERQLENLRNNYYLKDEDGNPILDEEGKRIPDLDSWLKDNGAVELGGPLFSNSNKGDDTEGITAKNISVSRSWSDGSVDVVATFRKLFLEDGTYTDHTTQNDGVRRMVTLMEKDLVFDPTDLDPNAKSKRLFEGDFSEMFNNMNTILGQDIREYNLYLNTTYTQMIEIDTNRDGVSGVDLNDEAMNMVQYQKAMTAAMRLMTAIDEALDRLINNTGIAGR